MLFLTLGLLLGIAVLVWCFVLVLTSADDDSLQETGPHMRLSPACVMDQSIRRVRPSQMIPERTFAANE